MTEDQVDQLDSRLSTLTDYAKSIKRALWVVGFLLFFILCKLPG